MFKNNKKFKIEYLMLLNKTFIDTIDEKECEEILKEIENTHQENLPFFPYKIKYYFTMDMKEQVDFDKYVQLFGAQFPTYVEEIDDLNKSYETQWQTNIHTSNKLDINKYILKLELFKRKGNISANNLLNELVKQVNEEVFPFLNDTIRFYATHGSYFYAPFYFHLEGIKEDLENGINDDIFLGNLISESHKKRMMAYYHLYYHIDDFDKTPTEEKFQELVNYWNENIDVWINQIESSETNDCQATDTYKIVNRMAMLQNTIGIKMLLMFITHPQHYKKMITEIPSLIDFIEWIKDDRNCFLYAYLEKEQIEILTGIPCSKKDLLKEIFGFTKHMYLSPEDFWIEKLNVIKYLIGKSIDIDKLFTDEHESFGRSLNEFYQNLEINLGEGKGNELKKLLMEMSFYYKINNQLPNKDNHITQSKL